MHVLQNFFGMLLGVATATYMPAANAADPATYVSEAQFGANGAIALKLEQTLNSYLMPLEVQQLGNSVYNVGQNYGASGQAISSSTPQMDFVSKHVSGYCSPNISVEKQQFNCSGQSGLSSTTAQFLEMGDIRTSVLLESVVYPTDGSSSSQSVLDIAAQNFIRNITMPFPSSLYTNYISNPTTFSKNSSQRKAYANYMANQALIGVARYALDEMYGMRVPGSIIGVSGGGSETASIMSTMENEASRRFTDPNYVAFLTAGTTDQISLLREIAAMHAFELWMNYQSYRQNERIAALLSAMLTTNVNAAISQANASISAGITPQ